MIPTVIFNSEAA